MTLLPIILVLLIAVVLLFFVLRDLGMMSKKQKILSVLIMFICTFGIGIYSFQKSQEDKRNFLLQMAFLRGETLMCKDQPINAKSFNLVTGTLSLIGKENTSSKNITYQLSECNIDSINNDSLQEQLEKD